MQTELCCWGFPHLQPCSGRQEGGSSSQRPPLGLLVRFRGSMRPVPFRLGMRSMRQAGTMPHRPGLSCTTTTAFRQVLTQSNLTASVLCQRPVEATSCTTPPCRKHVQDVASTGGTRNGGGVKGASSGHVHELKGLPVRRELACRRMLSPEPELWHREGSSGPERLLRGSQASPMPG